MAVCLNNGLQPELTNWFNYCSFARNRGNTTHRILGRRFPMGRRQTRYPIPVNELAKKRKAGQAEGEHTDTKTTTSAVVEAYDRQISRDICENVAILEKLLGNSDDVIFRHITIGNANQLPAVFILIDGLVDKDSLQESVMTPLMLWAKEIEAPAVTTPEAIRHLMSEHFLSFLEVKEKLTYPEIVADVLAAEAVLIVHGLNLAFVLGAKKWEHRAISDPATENLVRGPREGFNEVMKVNVALVRRRVKDPQFRVKYLKLGKRSVTDCALLYLEDVANPVLVDEVKRRIDLINIDGILDSGYIEQFIQDTPYSPFPQVQYTERPDRVAAAILEGRVAIVSDGSPNALIAPATLTNFLPAPEDYYERWLLMTAIRIVRTASLLNSILLPSLYIAFLNFHQEIIPSRLVLAIAGARAGVPFSAVVEAFIMEFTFELLREAGIRLPAPIASTIGIVGGIIIGQAAVSAGLVSPVMVIVVALTAIGSFAIPSFNVALSIRILRFPLMLLSAMFGLYGLTAGGILIVMHLVTLKSFGVPYLSPIAPLTLSGLTDTMVRAPAWQHRLRPLMFRPRNKYRSAPSTSYFQGKRAMHEHGFEVAPLADGAAKEGSET